MITVNNVAEARYQKFLQSPTAKAHFAIRKEVMRELHLSFERRDDGMHTICAMCRRSVAQLTQQENGHEIAYTYTVENLGTLFMAHYMQMHYDQEGRVA